MEKSMSLNIIFKKFTIQMVLVCATVVGITACNSGGSSTGSTTSNSGQLTFTPATGIKVTESSIRNVVFSLQNSTGVVNQTVNFNVSDTTVATVSPSACAVSSGSDALSSCQLTLSGLKKDR